MVIRRGAPLSFANAFAKPVSGGEAGGDAMAASIHRYVQHRSRIEGAYGRARDAASRFVLCLHDVEGAQPPGSAVATIDELATKLAERLGALPQEERS